MTFKFTLGQSMIIEFKMILRISFYVPLISKGLLSLQESKINLIHPNPHNHASV